jgi:hypothetical protein
MITSSSELRHPTSTPGTSSVGASEGQKTRINPCFRVVIIPLRQSLNRTSPPQLFSGGYATFDLTRMLSVVRRCVCSAGGVCARTDKLGFPSCNALDRDEEEHEEDGEDGKSFGCAGLTAASALGRLVVLCALAYYYSVIPSEDRKLIQTSDKVPPRGDVTS